MGTDVTLPTGQRAELIVVESYQSDGDPTSVLGPLPPGPAVPGAAASLTPGTDGISPTDGEVRVLGAVVIPGDEVVFYLVIGPSVDVVRRAFEAQGVDCVRVVTGAWVGGRPAQPVGPGRAG